MASDIRSAIDNSDVDRLKTLLEHKDEPLDDQGRTPLFITARDGKAECLSILVRAGADVNKAKTDNGATPAYVASYRGHAECLSILVGAGADVNKARTNDGATPAYIASYNGHTECLSILVGAGADVNKVTTDSGATPACVASQNGHAECLSVLVGAGADVNKAKTDTGATPAYVASQNGHTECLSILVGAGADVNKAKTDTGATPAFIASQYGHAECLSILVEAGADVNKANNNKGTPLIIAAYTGKLECAKVLVGAGADAALRDGKGKTALELARERNKHDVVSFLENDPAPPRPASAKRLPTPRKIVEKPVSEWNEEECIVFLKTRCRCDQYAEQFRAEGVRGKDLLQIDDEVLQELGVDKKLHRSRILEEIAAFKPKAGESNDIATAASAAVHYDLKFALVIGNQNYARLPLQNSRKDAEDVAAALEERGFKVYSVFDGTKPVMKKKFREFTGALKNAGTMETLEMRGGRKVKVPKKDAPTRSVFAAVFYAGHGHEHLGMNYLVGVENDFGNDVQEDDIEDASLSLKTVTTEISDARCKANTKQFSMVILDACRDDPIRKTRGGTGGGLAQAAAPDGFQLVYACAPGKTASDGTVGENGVFTKALLDQLSAPEKDPIPILLANVAKAVQDRTDGSQIPWKSDNISDKAYYNLTL